MIDLNKNLSRDFGNSLTIHHGGAMSQWEARHNLAVSTFRFGKATTEDHAAELVVLTMAQSIYLLIHGDRLSSEKIQAPCGYGTMRVIVPMLEALQERLNFYCGKLDCGTVSRWIETQKDVLESMGYEVRD
jgi:hypothetical protein